MIVTIKQLTGKPSFRSPALFNRDREHVRTRTGGGKPCTILPPANWNASGKGLGRNRTQPTFHGDKHHDEHQPSNPLDL
jgi:hypothetical protein